MLLMRLATDDLDTAMAATEELFPGVSAAPGDAPAHFHITAHAAAGITVVDYAVTGFDAHIALVSERFAVSELELEGRLTVGRDALDPALPFAIPPVIAADAVSIRSRVTQLDDDALLRFARADLGRDRFALRATAYAPVSPEAATHWRRVAELVRERMRDGLADEPLIGEALRQLLMAAYLHAFPTTWSEAHAPRDGHHAVPASIRRAIDYIERHAHEPIGVTDIAVASGLSVRGLQDAFRRNLDASPADYLRRLRLDRVRQDLLAADPLSGATVAGIARRWGFVHLGRFAQTYRTAFGELPGSTLQR
jgi:AraC-like DNA-binding protein